MMFLRKKLQEHPFLGRLLAVCFGALCMASSGSVYAITTYQNAIKATFNLSQTQVSLLASMANLGEGIAFPAGLMQEKLGTLLTLSSGSILSLGSYLALYQSVAVPFYYSEHYYVLAIYALLAGFGASFSYISALSVNLKNTVRKHQGVVVSILESSFSAGSVICALFYGVYFINDHYTDEENQNLRGFFLVCAIAILVINILGMIFLQNHPPDDDIHTAEQEYRRDVQMLDLGPETPSAPPYPTSEPRFNDLTGFRLLGNPVYHLIFWPFTLCNGLQFTFVQNLGTFLKSFHNDEYITQVTVLSFALTLFSKLFCGIASDRTVRYFPRVAYLIALNTLQSIGLFGSVFWADHRGYFIVCTGFVSAAYGALWCLTPTLLSEFFGTKHFARNWGMMLFGSSGFCWGAQVVFGYFYGNGIFSETMGADYCYGLKCYVGTFVIGLSLSVISVALNICLYVKSRQYARMAYLIVWD